MAATILARGDTLGGYKIEDIIGVGGMAIVYRAEQLALGRQVALKVIAPQLSANPDFRERFRREGRHIAGLDHPNVVTVFDSGEVEGRLFLAMRLVDGTTLADRMQGDGVSADETIALLSPIASALHTAHGLGLVHRDVKPQNILITANGHPYLADFGVAKAPSSTGGLTNTGAFVGSINYASPEQIRGERITSAGDVYALTAVLYQCLTGEVPFPRDTDAGVMHAHLNDPPPSLLVSGGRVQELDQVIQRGLAKQATERYETAVEVTSDAASAIARLDLDRRTVRPAFRVSVGRQTDVVNEDVTEDVVPRAMGVVTEAPKIADVPEPVNESDAEAAAASQGTATAESAPEATVPDADSSSTSAADSTDIIDNVLGPAPTRRSEETSADVRREAVSEPAPAPERHTRRRLVLAAVAGGVIVAAAAGAAVIAIPGSGKAVVVHHTLTSGEIDVGYTAPWGATASESKLSSAFSESAAVADGSTRLTIGTIRVSASVPGNLPPSLRSILGDVEHGTTDTVSGFQAGAYSWTSGATQVTALIVGGKREDFGLICQAPTTVKLEVCVKLAESARIARGFVVAPGIPSATASGLKLAVQHVSAARRDVAGMRRKNLSGRSPIAARLASIDQHASIAVGRVPVPSRDASLRARLVRALKVEGVLFTRLAKAAAGNHRSSYLSLGKELTKQGRSVDVAVRAFALAGVVDITAPAAIQLPALPAQVVHHAAAPSTPATPAASSAVSSAPVVQQPTYTPPVSVSPASSSAPSSSSSSSGSSSHPGLPNTINLGG